MDVLELLYFISYSPVLLQSACKQRGMGLIYTSSTFVAYIELWKSMSILCEWMQMDQIYYHMHMLGPYLLCCIVDTDLRLWWLSLQPTGENGATRAPIIIDMERGGNRGLAVVLEGRTQNVSASEWIVDALLIGQLPCELLMHLSLAWVANTKTFLYTVLNVFAQLYFDDWLV